ncbi:MAG: ATP-binding protein [Bacteroidales bacterium]|nr:ATP-binding protein [Bacteroidales bacterium]
MEETLYRYNPWWEGKSGSSLFNRPGYMDTLIEAFGNNRLILITGLRRVGKTSLMKLTIQHLMDHSAIDPKKILYVSMDDYNLKDLTILNIIDGFRKMHNIRFAEKIYVFLDEVVYQQDYEIQLKNLYDSQNVKVFASSSSASLLKERKHFITGRNRIIEVLPLDFDEYLLFKGIGISRSDSHIRENEFENFLRTGGMPEYVISGEPSYINELVDDIIMKDIAAIHNIRQPGLLKDFFLLLMERSGKQVSLNKIASIIGISVDTASRYFDMFERAYLIYPVTRHGKTNERLLSPKKIYAPDTGIRTCFTGFRDKGSLFENYVYLRLKKYHPEYIRQDQAELDFMLDNGYVVEAKYHNEPLTEKQQKLFEKFDEAFRKIVRNYDDLKALSFK